MNLSKILEDVHKAIHFLRCFSLLKYSDFPGIVAQPDSNLSFQDTEARNPVFQAVLDNTMRPCLRKELLT